MPYSSYDHDKLEAAETMRIERRIYFEAKDREIAPYASLPIAQLLSMRSESAAAEQAIFDDLKERAAAWEEQAGRTLLLDKTLEYVRTPHVQHTANEWQTTEHNRHIRSNRVYQMNYYIYENTRYDKEAQKSIPYSWTLTWSVRTNSPSRTQAKIAGQDRKVFTDKAAMEKYLNGRIKAYDRLFTEISPPIPQEYADYFKVNGMLMPDYTIEGEEPPQQQQAAAIPENTGQEKEREHMSEQFSIMIGNRSRFDAGDPGGYWLDMPATKEQLHEAMRNVGITADNPQDFSIRGYSDDPEKHIALPYEMVCAADVDELNFLAARLEQLDPAEVGKLNAALQQKNGLVGCKQLVHFLFAVAGGFPDHQVREIEVGAFIGFAEAVAAFNQRAEVARQIFLRFFNGFIRGGTERNHNRTGCHRDLLRHKGAVGANQRNAALLEIHDGEKAFLASFRELIENGG